MSCTLSKLFWGCRAASLGSSSPSVTSCAGSSLGSDGSSMGSTVSSMGSAVPGLGSEVPGLGSAVPGLVSAVPVLGSAVPVLGSAVMSKGSAIVSKCSGSAASASNCSGATIRFGSLTQNIDYLLKSFKCLSSNDKPRTMAMLLLNRLTPEQIPHDTVQSLDICKNHLVSCWGWGSENDFTYLFYRRNWPIEANFLRNWLVMLVRVQTEQALDGSHLTPVNRFSTSGANMSQLVQVIKQQL